MAARSLTQVYLDPEQRKALKARATAEGTKMSEEIRRAIDAYLAGVTKEELEMLDQASKVAAKHLVEMQQDLIATNTRLELLFAERDKIRSGV